MARPVPSNPPVAGHIHLPSPAVPDGSPYSYTQSTHAAASFLGPGLALLHV